MSQPVDLIPDGEVHSEAHVRRLCDRLWERVQGRPASPRAMSDKIVDRSTLLAVVEALRRRANRPRKPRIVFTNGCFDLLHPGHARYIAEAREEGDMLVVAMNDDAGIRRLKGEGRPLLPLQQRLKVMAALEAPDLVTWFDEETPIPLLRDLRPELLVKGGDYGIEGVVGHDVVPEWGGEVKVLSVSVGHSTSGLANRLREPQT